MKHILSCPDRDVTLLSLSQITGIDIPRIQKFLMPFKKSLAAENNPEGLLLERFMQRFSLGEIRFHASAFHGCRRFTRPLPTEHLLPNHMIMDQLWENIWNTCSDLLPARSPIELKLAVKKSSYGHELYKRTAERIRERGPWGFIIKDCFKQQNQDYYTKHGSEAVGCIIRGIHEELGVDIGSRLEEKTRSYIIHFRTNKTDLRYLGSALLYLQEAHKQAPFSYDHICYSEEGEIVSADQILNIEEV